MKFHPVFQNSLAITSVIGLGILVSTPADAITYTLDRTLRGGSSGGVVATAIGSITTDGTLGLLSTSNFVDWNITLTRVDFSGIQASATLTPNNSIARISAFNGSPSAADIQMRATASGISVLESGTPSSTFQGFEIFNFGVGSYTILGQDFIGGTPPSNTCTIAQQGTNECVQESISVGGIGWFNFFSATSPNGATIATSSNPTSVPEPSSVISLLSLGAIVAIGLGKKKA
ncbi:PEP-CTERM sorting domain-containing protein [Pannus brasiliensis CCIBt3594]|uniref:PEP-CTERM sorting domain-containing protein n=1 Tax=Pannus brasiliensis CCIBt3594 TaxID=1427578 RepID=A0AAW9QMU9_9CHRO